MRNNDTLRGEVHIKWYEDGRMSIGLPNDGYTAHFMLHRGLDELQERTAEKKRNNLVDQRVIAVPKDGMKAQDWGG